MLSSNYFNLLARFIPTHMGLVNIYIFCYFICGFNMKNSAKKSQNECNSITTIIPLLCLQLTLNKLMNLSNMKHERV